MSSQRSNYAATFITLNFVLAYVLFSTRPLKNYYKLDHNASPREDISKYGPQAVQKGQITQSTLDVLKRNEACHANSMDHFPFFIGAMLFAMQAGLSDSTINSIGAAYTVSRIAYGLAYIFISGHKASYVRSLLWWASNGVCFYALAQAGSAINA